MLYVGSFSVGLSTEAFVIPSEVFPLEYRAAGFSLAYGINRIFAGSSAIVIFPLADKITLHGVYFGFGIITFIGFILIAVFLVETKQKSLEEIYTIFKNRFNK